MKRILVILSILMVQGVEGQVSVFDCYINNPTPTQAELDLFTDYYANCIELSDQVNYDFGNDDNNQITARNFIHIEDGFHAGQYSPSGKMHLQIEEQLSFDVAVMNYTNLDWIGRYEKFELGVDLPIEVRQKIQNFIDKVPNSDQLNPFLDWEMRVYAEFYNYSVSPDPIVVDGFYTQNYDSWMLPIEQMTQNPSDAQMLTFGGYTMAQTDYPFLIRFAPPYNGRYQAKVIIEINGQIYATSNLFVFNVLEVGNQGYVYVGDNKRYLKKGQTVHYPVGMNMPWPLENKFHDSVYFDKVGMTTDYRNITVLPRTYDNYRNTIEYFADKGVNTIRTIMNPVSTDIEWEELGNYSGRLSNAQEMDKILEVCEENDVSIVWNFQIHSVLQHYNSNNPDSSSAYGWMRTWDKPELQHPYCYKTLLEANPQYNGIVKPEFFFSDAECKKYYKQRLRYALARWGYSTNISVLELYSEINNTGLTHPYGENYVPFRDWHFEMAEYVKSIHNGKVHILTTSYSGEKTDLDNSFTSPNLDVMSTNDYNILEPKFNKFLIERISEQKLNEALGNNLPLSYTMNNGINIKPMIFSEMGVILVEEKCRETPNSNEIEMNRSQWQGMFSGLAGGFGWEAWYHTNNTNIYEQQKQFIDGIDFDGGAWHPGASEQTTATPKGWLYKNSWAEDMVGKNNKADLMYLRSGDGNYAIGVITNRTYNVYSVASCFDDTWNQLVLDGAAVPPNDGQIDYAVHCGTGLGEEKLKVRGMNGAKYYINFFHPSNLSVPFHSTEDWGPEVEMDVTVNGGEADHIVLFMARREDYNWMPTNPDQSELEEMMANKELWENATVETVEFDDENTGLLNLDTPTNESSQIRIYPNPGKDELFIEFESHTPNAKIYLESMSGGSIANYNCFEKTTTINVSKLESGTYIVKIMDDSGILFITKYIKL